MSRLNCPAEWVAPLTPIVSLALLPLGPIFFPRAYVIFLFVYFTGFLYQQVNHVCKFYLSSTRIRANIKKWNLKNKNTNDKSESDKAKIAASLQKMKYDEEEEQLVFQDPRFIHTFVIPNYSEPEPLLRDTIGKLAVHR
jgi:hypothetical protein